MLLSLSSYRHDHPHDDLFPTHEGCSHVTRHSENKIRSAVGIVPVAQFSRESLVVVVTQRFPVNPRPMTQDRTMFVANNENRFCTSNGAHNSDGLKRCQVTDRKNMHRIEDDIYPEKTMSTMHTPDILHQACPPNCALLKTWLHSKAFIDQEFLRPDNDSETRSFIIVTGNCSGVSDTHHNGGVWVDANSMRIDCHFDDFDSLVFLTTDEKTFLRSPDDLDCDLSTNDSTGQSANSHIPGMCFVRTHTHTGTFLPLTHTRHR